MKLSIPKARADRRPDGAPLAGSATPDDRSSVAAPIDPDYATAWMADGNCRNYPPNMFFPSDGVGVDRARKICATCAVATTCLEYALDQRIEHGVWGGCSERERRRILKRRKADQGTAVVPVALRS